MIALGIELLLSIIITTWPCIKKLHTNLQVTLIENYQYFVHSRHHYPSTLLSSTTEAGSHSHDRKANGRRDSLLLEV